MKNNGKFTCKPVYGSEPKYDLWADNKPVLPRDYAGTVKTPYVDRLDASSSKHLILVKHKLETNVQWLNAPGKTMKVTPSGMPIIGIKLIDRRISPIPYKSIMDAFNGLDKKLELKMNKSIHKFIATARLFAIDENTNEEFDIAIFTASRGYHYSDVKD